MITPVRRDTGLGDPPKDYKNNDVEAGNFIIKYTLEWKEKVARAVLVLTE